MNLEDLLYRCVHDIQEQMAIRDINTSGASSRSFGVRMIDDTHGMVTYNYEPGYNAPLSTLEEGRGPGRQPPVSAIRQWLDTRGIGTESQRDNIAWAIAKIISKQGTRRFSSPSSVLSGPIEILKRDLIYNTEFRNYIAKQQWQRRRS